MTAVEAYLTELDGALRGPRRVKADLLAEARDSLTDAAEAYRGAGLEPGVAERRAVEDFGAVGEVAPGYQAELTLAQGRRTALLLFGSLAMQPFAWGATGPSFEPRHPEPGPAYHLVDGVIESLGGIALLVSFAAVLICGIGVRYLGMRPVLTMATGIFAYAMSATFVGLGVVLAVLGPDVHVLAGMAWFTVVLVLPLTAVAFSARRCLAVARSTSRETTTAVR